MAAYEVQIADAVVEELNDGARPWAGQFTAERSWLPVYEAKDLRVLRVSVVPLTIAQEELTRTKEQFEYGVAIDFQQMVDARNRTEVDGLALIAEQVLDFYRDDRELATLPGWTVREAKRPEVYDLDRLYQDHTFETIVELVVRGYR